MGFNTNIAWTDHTWSPWQGCQKISPGCQNCYMYRDKIRFGQNPSVVVRSKSVTFNAPLKWKDPARVFVCSWSDFFIENADAWRDEAWEIMLRTPHLTYQILTKRPENILAMLPKKDWPFKNVWLGVTAENQEMADKRIPILLSIQATIHFISAEPLLSLIDFSPWKLSLVIAGGESGPNARYMKPEWALDLKRQCQETNTPFFMKQMSGRAPIPNALRCREFPKV
jgi:protein gp37